MIDVALAEQLNGRNMHVANLQPTSFEPLLCPASEMLVLPLYEPQRWYSKLFQLGGSFGPDEAVPSALCFLPFMARVTGVETHTENPLPRLTVRKTLSSS